MKKIVLVLILIVVSVLLSLNLFEKDDIKIINLKVGETYKSQYNGKIAEIIINESSNVIIDENGKITAQKVGFADLNIKYEDGKDEKLKINILPFVYTVKFISNSFSNVEYDQKSCEITTINTSCTITTSNIFPNEGVNIVGWSTDKNANVKEYDVNATISINKNMTLYAITSTKEKVYTITFDKNGAKDISKTIEKCTIQSGNNDNNCFITLPTIIVNSGDKIIGWSTDKNATKKQYDVNAKISISKDMTLYAITYKPDKTYTVTFDKNGAKSLTKNSVSCNIMGVYNTAEQAKSCDVLLGGFTINTISKYDEIIGWSTDKNATKKQYDINTKISIDGDKKLYAVYKHKKYLRFYFNTASSISDKNIDEWTLKNNYIQKSVILYNGKTITINTPSIINSPTSFVALGFSKNNNTFDAEVGIGKGIKVNMNDKQIKEYYAITIPTNPLKIYMSTNGSSSNDGLSLKNSVSSLNDVHNIITNIYKRFGNTLKNVNIYIGGGTYNDALVVWRWSNTDFSGTINIIGDTNSKPVFLGNKQTSFLTINGNGLAKFNIKNIQLNTPTNGSYNNGMFIRNVNNSTFENMSFYRLGDYYTNTGVNAYGAIDFSSNSSYNTIKNCLFDGLRNRKSTGNHIHAVYLANRSSYNNVNNNTIKNCEPDPIRVRNKSNYNVVKDNIFINSGTYAFMSEWYKVDDVVTEEPSVGNKFVNNRLCSSWNNGNISIVKSFKNIFDVVTSYNDSNAISESNNIFGC